jgi:hypothetical protein
MNLRQLLEGDFLGIHLFILGDEHPLGKRQYRITGEGWRAVFEGKQDRFATNRSTGRTHRRLDGDF